MKHRIAGSLLVLCGGLFSACEPLALSYFELPRKLKTLNSYEASILVRGIPLGGIHGLTVTRTNRLLAGSVVGASIYEIRGDGEFADWVVREPPPTGMADDLEEGPDGTLVWTAFLEGTVYGLHPGAKQPHVIASGLPGVNSLAFDSRGRLFVTRVFLADELYEMDVTGKEAPRLLGSDLGGLNGFDFDADDRLYGPLWFKNKIIRLDPDAPGLDIEDVAAGFGIPAAVNFDPEGNLWAVDTQTGRLLSMQRNPDGSLAKPVLRLQLSAALDNLAVDDQGGVYVSNMADNSVVFYDPESGNSRTLISSPVAVVGDLAAGMHRGKNTLYLADLFALRRIELETGRVLTLARVFAENTEDGTSHAIDYPLHLGISPDGNRLVLTSWSSGTVQLFDLEANRVIASRSGRLTPHDAAFLQDGRILWLEYATGRLFIADALLQNERVLASGMQGPASLAVSNEAIYVSEAVSGNILRIDPATGERDIVFQGLERPEGIALNARGQLLVAEAGADRLVLLSGEPMQMQVIASGLELERDYSLPGVPITYVPVGVAVDADGGIYIGSNRQAAIYNLDNLLLEF